MIYCAWVLGEEVRVASKMCAWVLWKRGDIYI